MTTPDERSSDALTEFTGLIDQEAFLAGLDDPDQVDPRIRRRRRLWGWIIAAIVVLVLFGTPATYAAWALNAPLGAPVVTAQTPTAPTPAAAALALPAESTAAISVSGAEAYLGPSGIWATTGTDEPRAIASISKLITAMVVLDAHPLASADDPGPTITFSKADHDLYDKYYVLGATIAAMPTGSSMSLRDALAMMLVPSASNYAEAVSTWAFGSPGAFVGATRDWLDANGLAGTVMVEPTGISERNTSTPTDLIALGRIAAADPVIAALAAMPSLALPGLDPMSNTNDLLGTNGITGLKTGNLGPGTFGLLYTASLDAGPAGVLDVTGVALDGFSRDTVNVTVTALLDSIRAGFHDVPLITSGTGIGSITTVWGSTADLVVAGDASIFTWSDTPITVSMDTQTPVAYEEGEVVGTLTWTAGPNTATADIVIEGDIDPPTDWWRLTNPGELGG